MDYKVEHFHENKSNIRYKHIGECSIDTSRVYNLCIKDEIKILSCSVGYVRTWGEGLGGNMFKIGLLFDFEHRSNAYNLDESVICTIDCHGLSDYCGLVMWHEYFADTLIKSVSEKVNSRSVYFHEKIRRKISMKMAKKDDYAKYGEWGYHKNGG